MPFSACKALFTSKSEHVMGRWFPQKALLWVLLDGMCRFELSRVLIVDGIKYKAMESPYTCFPSVYRNS
eukprot:6455932-Amphidinium_carterae.1